MGHTQGHVFPYRSCHGSIGRVSIKSNLALGDTPTPTRRAIDPPPRCAVQSRLDGMKAEVTQLVQSLKKTFAIELIKIPKVNRRT